MSIMILRTNNRYYQPIHELKLLIFKNSTWSLFLGSRFYHITELEKVCHNKGILWKAQEDFVSHQKALNIERGLWAYSSSMVSTPCQCSIHFFGYFLLEIMEITIKWIYFVWISWGNYSTDVPLTTGRASRHRELSHQ